jgi:hypothetical protein
MLSEKCFLSNPQDRVKKRRVSIECSAQQEERGVALSQPQQPDSEYLPPREMLLIATILH